MMIVQIPCTIQVVNSVGRTKTDWTGSRLETVLVSFSFGPKF